ncbi:MAG: hypothetical protein SOX32_12630 [Candidatus Choladocola sp.]|nr:hypothetical protein [Candidatus Choladocola sp.]
MEQVNNVVARLSDIEAAAQQIMDQAVQQKKELGIRSRQQQEKFDQELSAKTKEALQNLSLKLENENRERLDRLKVENEKALADLEETYRCRHEQIAEELFRKVIEVS